MHRLPTELACFVFELLCFQDRVAVTHVCKLWRQIALGHGQLWSRIRCRDTIKMATLLERAHTVPVDLQVSDISWSNFDAVLELVAAHLGHIRVLVLQAADRTMKLDLRRVAIVLRSLTHAAPLLEVVDIQLSEQTLDVATDLTISGAHAARSSCIVPADVFLRQAPMLRQLSFLTMTLPPHIVDAFSAVTRLDLDSVRLCAAHLLALVQLPLRSLRLEVMEYELPQAPAPPGFQLDELWISGLHPQQYFESPGPLLRYLGFPNIRHFTSHGDAEWLDAVTSAPRTLPHTLLIEHWAVDDRHDGYTADVNSYEAWRLIADGGFVSDQLYVYTADELSWSEVRQAFANLRELVILYRELWDLTDDLEFPELLRLCLRVTAQDMQNSLRIWPNIEIACPKLRTLELWGGDGRSSGITTRSEEVLDFIEGLIFDDEQPPKLVIRDLDITGAPEDWVQVEEYVEDIERPEGAVPEPFVAELRSKWHAVVHCD